MTCRSRAATRSIYERAAFDRVHDADTAARARVLAEGPQVNCPIVAVSAR